MTYSYTNYYPQVKVSYDFQRFLTLDEGDDYL